MEEKRAGGFMVVLMVFGLLLVQSQAVSFSDCYRGCYLFCLITSGGCVFSCGVQCVRDCISSSPISPLDDKQQTHFFCEFGCASFLCANLSSRADPGEKKVESCVNSCSNRCSLN